MSIITHDAAVRAPIRESLRIAGEKITHDRVVEVRHPFSGALVGTVPKATLEDVRHALQIARRYKSRLTRYDRYTILMKAGAIIAKRRDEIRFLEEPRRVEIAFDLRKRIVLCVSSIPRRDVGHLALGDSSRVQERARLECRAPSWPQAIATSSANQCAWCARVARGCPGNGLSPLA